MRSSPCPRRRGQRRLSRSEVILKGSLAAGAVYGTSMVGPFVRKALAMSAAATSTSSTRPHPRVPRVDLLHGAKTRVKAKGELKDLISLLAVDEKQHVDALTATIKQLGGKPVSEPNIY